MSDVMRNRTGLIPIPTGFVTTPKIVRESNSEITNHNLIQVLLPCIYIVLAFFILYWLKIGISFRLDRKCRRRTEMSRCNLRLQNIKCTEIIGHGSFGTVLKGNYGDMDIALKITCIEKYSRWFNEKSILLENNDNDNVVKLFDYGTRTMRDGDKYLCLALEYADMGCLRNFLQRNAISLEECLYYSSTLTSALSYIHSDRNGLGFKKSPVVHQDIKSANVLLSSVKGCILADFGLATQLTELSVCEKPHVGTPRYMSPEKLKGNCLEGHLLLKSDIYALGLVLYEVACGCYFVSGFGNLHLADQYHTPYSDVIGCNPTIDGMREIVLSQNIRPKIPSSWQNNKILATLQDLIAECWAQDPHDRPPANIVAKYVRTLEVHLDSSSTCISILDS